jgi:hypothetical protein
MKNYVHLWLYLAEFLLDGEMFQIQVAKRKSKWTFYVQ